MTSNSALVLPPFLCHGGSTGALLRAHDWSKSPLGPPQHWPESLQTLVGLVLASSQPMFVAWGPQRLLLYNDAYAQVLGGKHPQALGRDLLEVWSELRAQLTPIVEQAYRGEPVQLRDFPLVIERNGYPEETNFSFSYSPVRSPDGVVSGIFCACMETTSQVLGERRLRDSEARYRDILARMDEAFIVLDREFRVIDVNEEALRIDQRSREQVLGRSHWALHPGSENNELGAFYRRAMASGSPASLEFRAAWPDGRSAWLEIRAHPVAEGLAVFFRDITSRRAAEERLQLALDAGAIIGTWVWDVQADRFQADERFARSFGLDPQPLREGLPLGEVRQTIHPQDQARVTQHVTKALTDGGSYRCEYRVRRKDGRYYWIEASGRVEMDSAGRPLRFPGVLLDVQDRHRAEEERDRATALLRSFIEAVPGVVYAKDLQGRMLVANRGTAELVGKPPEQFLGKTDAEFLDDKEQAATIMATDRRIMQSGCTEQVEEEVRRADGTPAWWLSTKAPLRDLRGRIIGLIGSSVDITERKREQEKARTEAEMLDLLNQTGTLLAGQLELEALLQSVTDAATRLTGARFGAFFYNGQNEQGEAYMLYTLSGAPREAFSKLGHPRPTPIFAPTFHGGPPMRLDDVTQDPRYGQWGPHHGMPKGHLQVRSYLAVSVTSRSGEVIGGLFFGHPEAGVFTERSERLATGIAAQAAVAIDNARLYAEAQRAASERKLLLESERAARSDAERASTLKDEFLATLSHELRTPLSSIAGWVHILRRRIDPDDPTLQKGVDVIDRSTRVQVQLIEDLLDMSRITSGKLKLDVQPVAAISFVQAAVDVVRPAAQGAGVRLELVAEAAVPTVMGDAARLQQVVWNLLSNAIKFTPAGGQVTVRLGTVDGQVRIAVADSGIGIPADFLPHVFDRFRQADGSTTRRYGGLGLGLSIVRHLVELHGGTITAQSAGEGQGACFTVSLPLMQAQGAQRVGCEPRLGADDVDLAGIRVLVVDDEPDVLDLLSRVLSDAGAAVRAVPGAAAALEAFEPTAPDVVVSDIGMPEIDGYELLARLRQLQSRQGRSVPAIALTAFARAEDRQRAMRSGFAAYLSKPVEPGVLLQAVARMAAREDPGPDGAEAA